MINRITKSKVISSMFWKLMERGGTQGIQLIVQIVLSRLLMPEDFGTIAIVLVFINLARVFVDSGLSTALIQKKDADNLDFSSVFYASLLIAGILYVIIYFSAPYIAGFYDDSSLTRILRVLPLTLFPGVFNSIQNAYVSRSMMFKKLFYSSLGAVITSGIAGIGVAYMGLGVWALVIQNLTSTITVTIIMWFTVKWRPSLEFSIERIKSLLSYSWKLLTSSLLYTLYDELRTLIIGRIYSPTSLGYYNRGRQLPSALVGTTDAAMRAVMFPTFSSIQDEDDSVKRMLRRSVKTSAFLMFPMMFGLAAIAEPAIKVFLGDKWLPAVGYLRILSVFYALQPIHSTKQEAIKAIGRSDIQLKIALINRIQSLIILLISVPFGIYAIAASQILSTTITAFIIGWPCKNLFNYSAREQIGDILSSLLTAVAMGVIVFLVGLLDLSAWQLLIIQIVVGVLIYVGLAELFKIESLDYIKSNLKGMVKKHSKQRDGSVK